MQAVIFGEDQNDCLAIASMTERIFKGSLRVRPLREPMVLCPLNSSRSKLVKNRDRMKDAVELLQKKLEVQLVIVHRDADACEPAHRIIAEELEAAVAKRVGVKTVAAVPAWELETWLMLFPDAIARTRTCWNGIGEVRSPGKIVNAKEHLRRKTRSKKGKCPDYRESDAPLIAKQIVCSEDDLKEKCKMSSSFKRYVDVVVEAVKVT